jgi:hypothetical protein
MRFEGARASHWRCSLQLRLSDRALLLSGFLVAIAGAPVLEAYRRITGRRLDRGLPFPRPLRVQRPSS